MLSYFIDENKMNCSEEQLQSYIDTYVNSTAPVKISLAKFTFDDLFNGNKIENPFDSIDARYYVLQINEGNIYLQTMKPFVNGIHMITDDNFDEVSKWHCEQITSQLLLSSALQSSLDHFPKLDKITSPI